MLINKKRLVKNEIERQARIEYLRKKYALAIAKYKEYRKQFPSKKQYPNAYEREIRIAALKSRYSPFIREYQKFRGKVPYSMETIFRWQDYPEMKDPNTFKVKRPYRRRTHFVLK